MLETVQYVPRCCERDNGTPDAYNETIRIPISPDGRPEFNRVYEVPARHGRAVQLRAGERIRIVNTHGTQVCDMWAFNSDDLSEYFSIEHTRGEMGRVNPEQGDALLTGRRRPILRFETDTSPGVHDTLIAACNTERYRKLGADGYHDNCSDNLRQALLAIGMRTREIPQPLNLWMSIPIADNRSVSFQPTVSRAGDYVEFAAEMDCIVVMSSCPQDMVDINGMTPKELHFSVRSRTPGTASTR
jgi:uncharacterized protein YcgI (DUF1989 family)